MKLMGDKVGRKKITELILKLDFLATKCVASIVSV